jgi:hypothetical protein
MARKLVGAIATKWYKILGHAGPDAIKQLPKYINSAELEELIDKRAPLKIECKVCSLASIRSRSLKDENMNFQPLDHSNG